MLTDGNYFDVTGTTTVTSIGTTGVVGTKITLHFDGIVTLTHHATDLILPGAANVTTAAGDEFTFIEYASGDWRCTGYALASGKAIVETTQISTIVQKVNVQDGAVATGTTLIPFDDTIPQITEGDEYMTLSITPTSATNILHIDIVLNANQSAINNFTTALFVGTTADALAVAPYTITTAADYATASFKHKMTAGTTSQLTFRVRAGGSNAGTTTFNGSGGARKYGGVSASSITITEITV